MTDILIMLSAAGTLCLTDGSSRPAGFWPEELVEPHRVFSEAGIGVTLATPGGKPAVADPSGLTPEGTGATPERCEALRRAVAELQPRLNAPQALERITADSFDAVFVPGGYAPMVDLWAKADCGRLLTDFHRRGKTIAAVCHGPVALLSCRTPTGQWPFAGCRMTAFSDAEEADVGLLQTLPWTAQQALAGRGARFLTGDVPWREHIVRDGGLLTGQNPASAAPVAQQLTASLRRRR